MKHEIDDDKLIEFGNYLKKLRFENGLVYEDIKKLTGIAITILHQIENGGIKK